MTLNIDKYKRNREPVMFEQFDARSQAKVLRNAQDVASADAAACCARLSDQHNIANRWGLWD